MTTWRPHKKLDLWNEPSSSPPTASDGGWRCSVMSAGVSNFHGCQNMVTPPIDESFYSRWGCDDLVVLGKRHQHGSERWNAISNGHLEKLGCRDRCVNLKGSLQLLRRCCMAGACLQLGGTSGSGLAAVAGDRLVNFGIGPVCWPRISPYVHNAPPLLVEIEIG